MSNIKLLLLAFLWSIPLTMWLDARKHRRTWYQDWLRDKLSETHPSRHKEKQP